jgi:hypothetical protein
MTAQIGIRHGLTTKFPAGGTKSSSGTTTAAAVKENFVRLGVAGKPKVRRTPFHRLLVTTEHGSLDVGKISKSPPNSPRINSPRQQLAQTRDGSTLDAGALQATSSSAPSSQVPAAIDETAEFEHALQSFEKSRLKPLECRLATLAGFRPGSSKHGDSCSDAETLASSTLAASKEVEIAVSDLAKWRTELKSAETDVGTNGARVERSRENGRRLQVLGRRILRAWVIAEFSGLSKRLSSSTERVERAFGGALELFDAGVLNLSPEEIKRAVADLGAGLRSCTRRSADAADASRLEMLLLQDAERLERLPPPTEILLSNRTIDDVDAARKDIARELRTLAKAVHLESLVETLVDRFECLSDPDGIDKSAPDAQELCRGQPTSLACLKAYHDSLGGQPVPIGALLAAARASAPYLASAGRTGGFKDVENALAAVECIVSAVALGDISLVYSTLVGCDAIVDKALNFLLRGDYERRAAVHADANDPERVAETQERARLAAQLRGETTLLNRKLEDALAIRRRSSNRPETLRTRERALGHGSAGVLRKDARFMEALKRSGGGAAGRDCALLVAHIADLEYKMLEAEHEAVGLHPELKNIVPASLRNRKRRKTRHKPDSGSTRLRALAPPAARPGDPGFEPLAHVGISNADLSAMGLDPTDIRAVQDSIAKLNRAGLSSSDQVHEAVKNINFVIDSVFRSETA